MAGWMADHMKGALYPWATTTSLPLTGRGQREKGEPSESCFAEEWRDLDYNQGLFSYKRPPSLDPWNPFPISPPHSHKSPLLTCCGWRQDVKEESEKLPTEDTEEEEERKEQKGLLD